MQQVETKSNDHSAFLVRSSFVPFRTLISPVNLGFSLSTFVLFLLEFNKRVFVYISER